MLYSIFEVLMCPVEEREHEIVASMIDSRFKDQPVAKIQCTECIFLNELQSSNLNDDSKG